MKKLTYKFGSSSTDFYLAYGISHLKKITDIKSTIIITDENIFTAHSKRFKGWNTIVLKPGEEFKIQSTVDSVIEQLIAMEADRKDLANHDAGPWWMHSARWGPLQDNAR